ncbi:unnamed protein product, partial [Closterium sp. NIES-53]
LLPSPSLPSLALTPHHTTPHHTTPHHTTPHHTTPHQVQVQATHGSRVLSVNTQQLVAYHEPPNAFPVSLEPHPPYKHRVAFCSPPVHSELDGRRLYEWLEYHYHLGVDYSIMYDAGGIDDEVTQVSQVARQSGCGKTR